MEPNPTFLDKKAARVALCLLDVLREGRVTPRKAWLVRTVLRYYIAPWDLIPDIIPGIGVVDDYVVLLMVAAAVGAESGRDDIDPGQVARQIRDELDKQ